MNFVPYIGPGLSSAGNNMINCWMCLHLVILNLLGMHYLGILNSKDVHFLFILSLLDVDSWLY